MNTVWTTMVMALVAKPVDVDAAEQLRRERAADAMRFRRVAVVSVALLAVGTVGVLTRLAMPPLGLKVGGRLRVVATPTSG
jgi:hypothetical protein